MNRTDPAKSKRQFARLVQGSIALSLGAMAAFLWSLKQVNPRTRFEFSTGTVIAFFIAAAASWSVWQVIARGGRQARFSFATFALVITALTVAAFAYGVKDVSRQKIHEVAIGAVLAILALSILGMALWRVVRFLEHDSQSLPEEKNDPGGDDSTRA